MCNSCRINKAQCRVLNRTHQWTPHLHVASRVCTCQEHKREQAHWDNSRQDSVRISTAVSPIRCCLHQKFFKAKPTYYGISLTCIIAHGFCLSSAAACAPKNCSSILGPLVSVKSTWVKTEGWVIGLPVLSGSCDKSACLHTYKICIDEQGPHTGAQRQAKVTNRLFTTSTSRGTTCPFSILPLRMLCWMISTLLAAVIRLRRDLTSG